MPPAEDPGSSAVDRSAGISQKRERYWGIMGGIVGSLVGVGSFLIASLVQREDLADMVSSTYPPFFHRREIMPLDFYFLALLIVGSLFLAIGLVQIRVSPYPRSDGYGASLLGTILSLLGGLILFIRVWALLH